LGIGDEAERSFLRSAASVYSAQLYSYLEYRICHGERQLRRSIETLRSETGGQCEQRAKPERQRNREGPNWASPMQVEIHRWERIRSIPTSNSKVGFVKAQRFIRLRSTFFSRCLSSMAWLRLAFHVTARL